MRNTVIDFLYDTVQKYPDRICLADGQQSISFIELFTRASSLADILLKGKKINEPVLVYLPEGVSAIVSFAGILMSGNFYVPVDIKSPQKRLQAILENLSPYRVISVREYKEDLLALSVPQDKILFL